MIRRREVVLTARLILVAFLGVCFFVVLDTFHERWLARRALNALQKVEIGSTSTDVALELMKPFRSHSREFLSYNPPQVHFAFGNRLLSTLRVAPNAELRIQITFSHDVVVEKRAWELASASGCSAQVTERMRGHGFPSGVAPTEQPNHRVLFGPFSSEVVREAPNSVWHIRVEDDETYPARLRREDWDFNLSCLTRIGRGCWDAREMLPRAVPTVSTCRRSNFKDGEEVAWQ